MYYTVDDVEIFEFISRADIRINDFTEDKVLSFDYNSDYHLVIYQSDGDDIGFSMFVIKDYKSNLEELIELRANIKKILEKTNLNVLIEAKLHVSNKICALMSSHMAERKKTESKKSR